MGVPVLSSGRTRVAVLTVKPANIAAPTAAELTAGIYASPYIPKSLWKWAADNPNTVTDSDLEKAFDVEVPISDKYSLGFGVYRRFNAGGGFDATDSAEVLFAAAKARGTNLYIYARKTDKLSTAAWATTDEVFLGGQVVTGTPKAIDDGANIKYEIPLFPVALYSFFAVA